MKYYSEENNGQGQEKMITKGKLRGYINWLNETKGGSFLRATASGSNRLVIERMNDISSGTIHWTATRDTQSSQLTASTTASSITITSNYSSRIPRGKFYLVGPDGTQYTELDNSNGGDNYSGFEDMTFIEADEKLDTYCLTYSDLSGGTYARVFDVSTMKDGIVIDGYSISSSGQYKANQLVAEKDVNFGKLEYDLVVSSITVEVDAMNDLEEYRRGVIPGSNGLAYATVYDVTNGTETPFYNFDLNGAELTDNAQTSGKTYSGVTISKGGNIAKASKRKSGSTDVYAVDVYFYADSGYTLSSQTIATKVGTASGDKYISASTHSFSSNSTSPSYSATSRMVKISIASNGEVKFDIKQRKEIYGYFPVSVYKQGTSDFSIDENGNVELSAADKFVKAALTSIIITNSFSEMEKYISGWTDNAGDNFGNYSLNNSKVSLYSNEKSVYDDVLTGQGINDMSLCGKDVYNANNIVYDRGEDIGNSVYHVAYANDAYKSMDNESGFKDTRHFFCSGGTMSARITSPTCTSEHFDYTYDKFTSDYLYGMYYERTYWKDTHSYGITSIMRRFRKIGVDFVDTSKSSYSEDIRYGDLKVDYADTVIGNSFPKHIYGRTFRVNLDTTFRNANEIKSGENYVSGWTSIFENIENNERATHTSLSYSGNTTIRNIKMVAHGGYYSESYNLICESNNIGDNYYYEIHPYFYMVDAEHCDGKSSGYTFSTPKTITDTSYGGENIRDYYLDDGHCFLTSGYTNNQMARKDMISYINLDSDGNPIFDSVRYGDTNIGGYVNDTCMPSAPQQRVYWIDSYAPNSGYGGKIVSSTPIAFVDEENRYVGDGAPELKSFIVPGHDRWNYFPSSGIGVNEVNEFESGYTVIDTSYAGQVYYSGATNTSDNSLQKSINFLIDSNAGYDNYAPLGYSIESGYTTTMRAVSSLTSSNGSNLFVLSGDSYVYTGDTYVHFGRYGALEKNDNYGNSSYRFAPLVSNNRYFPLPPNTPSGTPLRPCLGDITVPYWYTQIDFGVTYAYGIDEEVPSAFDPISDFDLAVEVSTYSSSGYHELTTSTTFDSTNNITYAIFYNQDDNIPSLSEAPVVYHKSIKGIYGYLCKNGTPKGRVEEGGFTRLYQKMTLYMLFIDVYPANPGDFNVRVKPKKSGMTTQMLWWRLNGRYDTSVGADNLYRLSLADWGNYESNDYQNKLSCIGRRNNEYSVIRLMTKYSMSSGQFMPFDTMTFEDNYATKADDTESKGTWY